MSHTTKKDASASVVVLAERVGEVIEVTELEPFDGTFIGKQVNRNGSITQYPTVTWWKQRVARVPASVSHVFAYLREARTRNVCLIRGAPANVERQRTRRRKAGVVGKQDRRDHGFLDEPTKLFSLDVDGAAMKWRDDPEGAVRALVAQLGELWASASFCWFFSATHGLEMVEVDVGEEEKEKRWTGKVGDDKMRVRLVFIAERPLTEREAVALTNIMKARAPELKLDRSVSFTTQPNYIRRPLWAEHPDRDVLGDIPTIGWVKGTRDCLAIPDDLAHQARWAKAQGQNVDIADHPDAEAAVRGIGGDGHVRQHLLSAVVHLLIANECPDAVSYADHSIEIVGKLRNIVERHRDEIVANLERHHRYWADVLAHLADMAKWAHWCLDHQGVLKRKTIKLEREERVEPDDAATREGIFARVERAIEQFSHPNPFELYGDEFIPTVVLLVAPTGSRKSTLMRTAAVRHVTEQRGKSVVILVPLHKLGDEQVDKLRQEHPDGNYSAAVWRGRHADDPDEPHQGKFRKMCWRSDEAEEVEKAMLDVEHALCKQGRGTKAVKCPFFDRCGYQRQKQVEANIWFAAHEMMTHAMPKAMGDVGWVMVDESPLDAFVFGIDIDDQMTLGLDTLKLAPTPHGLGDRDADELLDARGALYRVLDQLRVPIEHQRGVAASRSGLRYFIDRRVEGGVQLSYYDTGRLRGLEWRGKVVPDITPTMTKKQVRKELAKAAGNPVVKKLATLWQLLSQAGETGGEWYGRIQLHRGDEGRIIRMVGLHPIAKGWNVRTLICDATGDAELLRAVWPQLRTDKSVQGWQQLPRPRSVRVLQCVDRSISKWAVAVESKHKKKTDRDRELAHKAEGARRLYAALLTQAMEYGGEDVGVIVYKSTRVWIEENCFVPSWLKLFHHGGIVGTNALQNVRALFVVGRPLASPEDVARQTEALFGGYVAEREYRVRRKRGRIETVPLPSGVNVVKVDVREMKDAMAQRVARQITEAAIIQAAGRARAGLRGDGEPLDLHLWTDVPVPELGPVEPVLWEEVAVGLDGLMLASGGVWLESATHAAKAYPDLFTVNSLRSERRRHKWCNPNRHSLLEMHHLWCRYQLAGERKRPSRALIVLPAAEARAWLEKRLGRLARFEVEGSKEEAV